MHVFGFQSKNTYLLMFLNRFLLIFLLLLFFSCQKSSSSTDERIGKMKINYYTNTCSGAFFLLNVSIFNLMT